MLGDVPGDVILKNTDRLSGWEGNPKCPKPGQVIGKVVEVREKSRAVKQILDAMETVVRRGIPPWIEIEKEKFRGVLKALPNREDLTMPIQEQLIVELYSK